ncbi:hypothetical protein GGI17_004513 [Coemansia sp. S146]|nr:hypothetical protein GGI17_004513 [Coemansia sp. S146]
MKEKIKKTIKKKPGSSASSFALNGQRRVDVVNVPDEDPVRPAEERGALGKDFAHIDARVMMSQIVAVGGNGKMCLSSLASRVDYDHVVVRVLDIRVAVFVIAIDRCFTIVRLHDGVVVRVGDSLVDCKIVTTRSARAGAWSLLT